MLGAVDGVARGGCPTRKELFGERQSSIKIHWGASYVARNKLTYRSNGEKQCAWKQQNKEKGSRIHKLLACNQEQCNGLDEDGYPHFISHRGVFKHSREQKFMSSSGGKPPDPHFYHYLSLSSLFLALSFVPLITARTHWWHCLRNNSPKLDIEVLYTELFNQFFS